MNPFVHEFTVDLRSGAAYERARRPLSQGNAYADKLVVRVVDGRKDIALDGVGVSAKVIRYDGLTVPLVGTVEGGAACIVLDDACYGVPGDIKVSVILSAGDMVQTVLALTMNVETSETSIIVDNGTVGDLTEVLTAIAEVRAATAEAHKAAEDAKKAIAQMSGIEVTASGPLVNVKDAADFDAVQVVSEIKPTVEGVESVTLTHTGRNVNPLTKDDVAEIAYTSTSGENKTVKGWDIALPPGDYSVRGEYSVDGYTNYVYGIIVDADGTATGKGNISPIVGKTEQTVGFTLDDGERLVLYNGASSDSLSATKTKFGRVNIGIYPKGCDTTYEPYNGTTLTAELPETVYGGKLDWTSGLLTITHGADGTELDVPRTAQIAPQTLEMLKGENNVWSDTGDTSLTYNADIKMYIDAAIAEIAAAIINA